MEVELNTISWTEGGTFITNFEDCQLKIYEQTVKQFNKDYGEEIMAVSYKAFYGDGQVLRKHSSLHQLKNGWDGVSFWRLFEHYKNI